MHKQYFLFLLFLYATLTLYSMQEHQTFRIMTSDEARKQFMIFNAGVFNPQLSDREGLRKALFDLQKIKLQSNIPQPAIERKQRYLLQQFGPDVVDPYAFCYHIIDQQAYSPHSATQVRSLARYKKARRHEQELKDLLQQENNEQERSALQNAIAIHQFTQQKEKYIIERQKENLEPKIKAQAKKVETFPAATIEQAINELAHLHRISDECTKNLEIIEKLQSRPYIEGDSDSDSGSDSSFELIEKVEEKEDH